MIEAVQRNEEYRRLFESVTGFSPYEYQKQCFGKLHSGKSIILQAPTGSGKTLAAILPLIYNWIEWKEGRQTVEQFPRKLIYSLPLRTLANSLYIEISNLISKLQFADIPKVTLQTGENSDDIFFEGDIIFTTIDQTLSNVLSIQLSLPNKLANINAGAVLSSYLVFDEFHLLDPRKSLSTTLIILNKLKEITPFCLMTATLTDVFISKIGEYLSCDIVKVPKEDVSKFTYIQKNQRRILHIIDDEIQIDNIIENHKGKTIVICNTVDSCTQKAKNLLHVIQKKHLKTKIICLHSRFFQKDRNKKEKTILEYFGKNSTKTDVILITTQIIEVGMDISCDVMITEISPINSFLQRIGRSARWGRNGDILVYNQKLKAPYDAELSKITFEKLNEYNNEIIDSDLSNILISDILSDIEESIFVNIRESSELTWDNIVQSWQTGNKGFARQLIRDIHSINIVLITEDAKIKNLYGYESISMNPFSLKSKLNNILNNMEGELPQIAFNLQPSPFYFDEDDDDMVLAPISVDKIEYENIVALNSEYVGYSHLFGLDFTGNYGQASEKNENKNDKLHIKYQYDTFKEHNNWMIDVFNEMYSYQFPLSKIKEKHYSGFDFDKLIKFMIICHDFGKLNDKWQEIVQKYQSLKLEQDVSELLAHTDYDRENEDDVELMKQAFKVVGLSRKPDHSGIGARFIKYAMPFLFNLKKERFNKFLVDVLVTSVIRHHTAFADTAPKFKINLRSYDKFINYLYTCLPNLGEIKYPKERLLGSEISTNDFSINFQQSEIAFLYFVLVRILRLCDQNSFGKNPRKED